MKFQNPSLNFFLNGRTNKQTDKPKAICSPLFQSWGHNDIAQRSRNDLDLQYSHIFIKSISFRSQAAIVSE